jgi:signal peptidase I
MERSILREYAEAFIIAVIFLRFTQIFILQTFYIPSGSMENTLLVGDHLFVNRFVYGPASTGLEQKILPSRDVQRGDIVVFRSPENPNIDVVKRCVGVPGDTIDVRAKQLYINGKAVQDAGYAIHGDPITYSELSFSDQGRRRDNFGPETVPPGHYFCMGDNRGPCSSTGPTAAPRTTASGAGSARSSGSSAARRRAFSPTPGGSAPSA